MRKRIHGLTNGLKRATREVNSQLRQRSHGMTAMQTLTTQVRQGAAELLSAQSLKFLQKMAQGKKGQVNIGLLKDAIGQMTGWKIEDTLVVFPLNGKWDLLKSLVSGWVKENNKLVNYFGGSSSKSDPFEISFREGVSESQAKVALQGLSKYAKFVASAPASGSVGSVFVTKPTKPEVKFGKLRSQIKKAWVVVPGWSIKAANGATVTFPQPLRSSGRLEDPSGMKLARFWTWGYKNGLKESATAALAAMDQEELAYKTAPKSKRDLVRREQSEEVRKVLQQVVDAKFKQVVSAITDAATRALARFMAVHDEYVKTEREKGNNYPRFFLSHYFNKERPHESFYMSAVSDAIERPDNFSETWVKKSDWKKRIQSWAQGVAERARDGFIAKNNGKLTRIVKGKGNLTSAKIQYLNPGDTDYGGEIKFEFEDGSSFIVRNKTVWKYSSQGRSFAQFPTTFHDVFLPDGSKMRGVSERKMLETFAGISADDR